MKRICTLLLALLLLGGCTADPTGADGEKDGPTIRKKPPTLTVQAGENRGQAALSTYSWTWPNGDGTYAGVEADGLHPLDMANRVTPLPLGFEGAVTLTFDLDGLALDQLTVRRWDMACAGDPTRYESDFETLSFTVDGDTATVALPDSRGGIFEVHAYFTGESHGDGYYAFCLEGLKPRALAYSVQTLRIGWREGLAEQPQARIIRSREELQAALAGETVRDGALSDWDQAFFADHELVMILLEEGSGSIGHQVMAVLTGSDGVTVAIHRTVPEICTADMAAWLVLVELPAGAAGENVTVQII